MSAARITLGVGVLVLSACTPDANVITGTDDLAFAKPSKETDPKATWYLPLDESLSLQSDGLYPTGDGVYSVYAPGVCGTSSTIFATSAQSGSGDATLQTSAPKGKSCGRAFRIRYPDGAEEFLSSFLNLNRLQNASFSIPIGNTLARRFVFSPGAINVPSRCYRLSFGENNGNFVGSDSLLVTRVNASTWDVQSAEGGAKAFCQWSSQSTAGEIYEDMVVRFRIVADRDLM